MKPLDDLQRRARRNVSLCAFVAIAIAIVPSPARADRSDDFDKLEAEFAAARDQFAASHTKKNPTDADFIRNVEDYQLWPFILRFLALAEANPADDTSLRCCDWIITKNPNFAGDRAKFEAEQKAWAIIAAHHAVGDRVPEICLEAAQAASPQREKFLRDLLKQPGLSNKHAGYATLALAETIIKRMDEAERFQKQEKTAAKNSLVGYLRSRMAPEYVEYLDGIDMNASKAEAAQLLRTVLDRYANVPNKLSKGGFRNMATLGDKARKSLHAIERLTIGAEAPDIIGHNLDGQPLKLADHRGCVVLLSFWFAGCGPCMELVSKEQELVKKFNDRSFTLLGVCTDDKLDDGLAAAKEHGMTWQCWFDGGNGPIARDYNITGWPTFYLLDKDGRIVAKDMDRDHIEDEIAALLDKNK